MGNYRVLQIGEVVQKGDIRNHSDQLEEWREATDIGAVITSDSFCYYKRPLTNKEMVEQKREQFENFLKKADTFFQPHLERTEKGTYINNCVYIYWKLVLGVEGLKDE